MLRKGVHPLSAGETRQGHLERATEALLTLETDASVKIKTERHLFFLTPPSLLALLAGGLAVLSSVGLGQPIDFYR